MASSRVKSSQDEFFFLPGEDFAIFTITGKDAEDFLHRMVSNDVRTLVPGNGVPCCFLSPQGRILLYFDLWRTEEGYELLIWGKQKTAVVSTFERYLFREEVTVEAAGDRVGLIVAGETPAAILPGRGGCSPLPEPWTRLLITVLDEVPVTVYGVGWLSVPTFLFVTAAENQPSIIGFIESCGGRRGEWETFHTLRIEKGTPWPDYEVDDSMIPFECGLEQAVSLTKGCFVGQEIVARMHNLGETPRKLVGLVLGSDSVPPRGAGVFSEDIEVGRVLTAGFSRRIGKPIVTSSVRRKFAEAGTLLTLEGREAEVRKFPLA